MKYAALLFAMLACAFSGYFAWMEYHRPAPQVVIGRITVPASTQSDIALRRSAELQVAALQGTMKELERRGFDVEIKCSERYCWSDEITSGRHYRVDVSKTTELK